MVAFGLAYARPSLLRVQADAAIIAQVGSRTVHRPAVVQGDLSRLQLTAHSAAFIYIGNGLRLQQHVVGIVRSFLIPHAFQMTSRDHLHTSALRIRGREGEPC